MINRNQLIAQLSSVSSTFSKHSTIVALCQTRVGRHSEKRKKEREREFTPLPGLYIQEEVEARRMLTFIGADIAIWKIPSFILSYSKEGKKILLYASLYIFIFRVISLSLSLSPSLSLARAFPRFRSHSIK